MVLDLEAEKIEIALGKFSFSPGDTIEETSLRTSGTGM